MPKKSKKTSNSTPTNVYQLKITLNEVAPPVWRRVQVEDCSLADLHVVIQICMGWDNYHLYAFNVDGMEYSDPEMGGDGDCRDSCSLQLSQLASQGSSGFTYLYDFGDGWMHVVEIEKTLPSEPKTKYPCCIEGKRACPPEDCGGPYGYENFLEAIQNTSHEEHEEMLEWVGGKFNPGTFSKAKVNRQLQQWVA